MLAISTLYSCLYTVTQPDHYKFLLPWLRAITSSNGLDVFSTDFSNYTGGYISILAFVSLFKPVLSELVIIKVTAVIGTGMAAVGVAACMRATGWRKLPALNAGLIFMLLPSAMLNGVAWGQADAFYCAFILYSMAAVLSGRPLFAAMFFAVAISFKLQAILFAPFLFGFLLRTPRKLLLGLILVIPIFFLTNALYLVAGRPVWDVATIYADQAQTFHRLSMNAGNPWLFLDLFLDPEMHSKYYSTLVLTGLIAAFLVAIGLSWKAFRVPILPLYLVLLAALTTLILPFLLPKMHERFFFMAESFILISCLMNRNFLTAAIAVQLSALAMYSIYHDTFLVRTALGWPHVAFAGIGFMMLTIVLFVKTIRHVNRSGAEPPVT